MKSELLAKNAHAGFSDEVQKALRAHPSLVGKIAGRLVEQHFPDSLHPGILAAVVFQVYLILDEWLNRLPSAISALVLVISTFSLGAFSALFASRYPIF